MDSAMALNNHGAKRIKCFGIRFSITAVNFKMNDYFYTNIAIVSMRFSAK